MTDKKNTYLRFTCRTPVSAAMLRQAMEDRAAMDGIPVYSAFEDALLEASLPKDPFARRFIQLVLGEQAGVFEPLRKGMSPVQHALLEAFKTLADVDNGFWKLPETKKLVRYAVRYVSYKLFETNKEDGVFDKLPRAGAAAYYEMRCRMETEPTPPEEFEDLMFSINREVVDVHGIRPPLVGVALYGLTESWNEAWALPEVRNLVLALLESSNGEEDSVKDRTKFAEVCRAVMPAWTAENAKRRIEAERRRSRILTKSRAIKGATLNYPVMWEIANPKETAKWSHAAKVSVVKAVAVEHPVGLENTDESTRIVLLPCPFEDVGETEEERSQRVIEMAAKSWPDLPRILDAEVELRYAENGKPLNWNEWKASIRVNVSKVPETSAAMAAASGYEAWIEEDIRN